VSINNATLDTASIKTNDAPWHALDCAPVFERLASSAGGLPQKEAAHRLALYGPNRLRPPKKRGPFVRLLYQFHNLLIYVLLVAAGVTAMLAHWVHTGVILGVVIPVCYHYRSK
jgi:magnesium-transporting ATPase (P-type)